jgi:hypothetical protein
MRIVSIILLLIGTTVITGCGADPTVSVSGIVKLDGSPAANLLVYFTPKGNKESKVVGGSAVSDTQGKFTIVGDDGRPGLLPGKYTVFVVDNNLNVDDESTTASKARRINRVPQEYSSPATTPLELLVSSDQNEHTINIVTK